MNPKSAFIGILLLLALTGYAKMPKPQDMEADSLFALGERLYAEGNFRKAVQYLDYFIMNYPVKDKVPVAQYHLADSYYKLRRYQEASVEFEFLYKQFTNSEFAEEAQIRAAESIFEISEPYYKEQILTLDAKRKAENFIERYPNSEFVSMAQDLLARIDDKLAQKELEAAKLYFQFKEYEAAIMSLEYILATYPGAKKTNTETSYYLGRCKAELGETEEAEAILEELLDDPVWQKKAEKALNKIEKQK
ncbi:outer membrane protein assembly factor BamD [candidate division WOR-3 bacterium]|nr:outer membrane protein assembly factor BamD [candidate division WOR-3 bacterium]